MSLNKFYMLLYPFMRFHSDYTQMHIFSFLAFTGVGKRAMLGLGKESEGGFAKTKCNRIPTCPCCLGGRGRKQANEDEGKVLLACF